MSSIDFFEKTNVAGSREEERSMVDSKYPFLKPHFGHVVIDKKHPNIDCRKVCSTATRTLRTMRLKTLFRDDIHSTLRRRLSSLLNDKMW